MRIGIDVTPVLYEGTGIGQYTKQLVRELLRQNPEDEFVLFFSAMRGYGKIRREIEEIMPRDWDNQENRKRQRCRIVGIPFPPAFWQIVWNRLNLIKIEWLIGKIDVFHCWDYLIPPSDCRRVVTIHDLTPILYPETHTEKIKNNFKLIINKIKKEKIQVLTDSVSSKQDLIKHIGIEEDTINVIYLGGGNLENKEDKGDVVKQSTVNGQLLSNKFLLCAGTREPRKNLKKAIEAFSLLTERYPDVDLVIAGRYGWGKDHEFTNLRIHESRIKILGFIKQEDLVWLYKNAICLVYPSLYEGFGLPVLEAMQFGCPVVTSHVSSLPEIGGEAVLYADPGNAQEIESSIIRIIEENDLRYKLINKGLIQAKKFSWEKCAKETHTAYTQLLH